MRVPDEVITAFDAAKAARALALALPNDDDVQREYRHRRLVLEETAEAWLSGALEMSPAELLAEHTGRPLI